MADTTQPARRPRGTPIDRALDQMERMSPEELVFFGWAVQGFVRARAGKPGGPQQAALELGERAAEEGDDAGNLVR